MPTKPTVKPQWAENDVVDPTSGQNNVSEPPLAKKTDGIDFEEIIPRQWQNWLQRIIYRWIDWLDGTTIPLSSSPTTTNEQKADGTGHTHQITGVLPAAVSGYVGSRFYYIDQNGDSQGGNLFDISLLTKATWTSFGKTGSGLDEEWSALDALPATVTFIDISIVTGDSQIGSPTDSALIQAFVRPHGSTTTIVNASGIQSQLINDTALINATTNSGQIRVAVNSDAEFDLYLNVNGVILGSSDMKLVGFGSS